MSTKRPRWTSSNSRAKPFPRIWTLTIGWLQVSVWRGSRTKWTFALYAHDGDGKPQPLYTSEEPYNSRDEACEVAEVAMSMAIDEHVGEVDHARNERLRKKKSERKK